MLADLEYETVDYADNYDGKYREPLVLPSKFPNLLVNGSDGIAVGMATDIPPHNLREVCDAAIRLIDDPEVTLTAAHGDRCPARTSRPAASSADGRASSTATPPAAARSRSAPAPRSSRQGNRSTIVINEVPFQQTRNRLAEAIGELVKNERIKGINEIRDESSLRTGEPVRLVIYLKRDADPNLILNQLYQFSPLEKTASIILLALVDGQPRYLELKEMLEEFIRHRVQVIRRRTEYQTARGEAARPRPRRPAHRHFVAGRGHRHLPARTEPRRGEDALQNLEVAATVLGRAIGEEHFAALQREIGVHASYRMTEAQAEAVVRMQLGQLAQLERDEIIKEYNDLRDKIHGYETLLSAASATSSTSSRAT